MALNRRTDNRQELEKSGRKEISLTERKRKQMKNNKWYRNDLITASDDEYIKMHKEETRKSKFQRYTDSLKSVLTKSIYSLQFDISETDTLSSQKNVTEAKQNHIEET